MIDKKKMGKTLAAAAALAFTAVATTSAYANEEHRHMCKGVNACKGQGACKTSMNDCAGKNSCKGKGVIVMDKETCKKEGGEVVKRH